MFLHTDRKLLLSHLRPLSVLVLHVLLTHLCTGSHEDQPELFCSDHQIVALAGDCVVLPCHIEPAISAISRAVVWTKPGLIPKYIHIRKRRQPVYSILNVSYRNRTALFVDELKSGNVSLKLSNVKICDAGKYFCILESIQKEASIQLIVGVVSSPIIKIVSNNISGLVLQCESEGWYPEPEVSWLDAEGHVLSAGPTETVRGPDGLYTVSSRVTVEERHRNNFTCRVQQKDINQIRETQISITDELQSSSSAATLTLAVSLSVCILIILFILLPVFFCWRQNRKKTKKIHRGKTDKREKNSFITKIEEEKESEPLKTEGTEQNQVLKKDKVHKRRKYPCEVFMKMSDCDQVKNQNTQNFTEEKQRNEKEQKLQNDQEQRGPTNRRLDVTNTDQQ